MFKSCIFSLEIDIKVTKTPHIKLFAHSIILHYLKVFGCYALRASHSTLTTVNPAVAAPQATLLSAWRCRCSNVLPSAKSSFPSFLTLKLGFKSYFRSHIDLVGPVLVEQYVLDHTLAKGLVDLMYSMS